MQPDCDPLISPEELFDRLGAPDLRVLDGSMAPPGDGRDVRAAYAAERIDGAVFFDIDEVADLASPLPHMAPPPEKFASRMRKAGVGDGMDVVVYDQVGLFSAPRVWWTFRLMGCTSVRVLDGGLPAWKAAGLPVDDAPPLPRGERHFSARRNALLIRDLPQMRRIVESGAMQVLDARSPGRFAGREPEPREGLRGGHMPGAINAPYSSLLNNGRLLEKAALKAAFEAAGVDLGRPIVTTCGSGITAAVLALALARLGRWDVAVYDGSWAEWGALSDAPVETA